MRGPAGKPQGAVMNRLSVLGTGDLFRPYNGQDGKRAIRSRKTELRSTKGKEPG